MKYCLFLLVALCVTSFSFSQPCYVQLPQRIIPFCYGDSIVFNGTVYGQSVLISDTVPSINGCDTIKHYFLKQSSPPSTLTVIQYICLGDTAFYSGLPYYQDTTFTDTVLNAYGCDSNILVYKVIAYDIPLAQFTILPDPNTPHNWYALNQSIGDSLSTYTWYWGDGTSDTGSAASHIYASEGYYNICLKATNGMGIGCDDTYCDSSTYIFKAGSMVSINVVNEFPTGINEVKDIELSITPNPTSGIVNLSTDVAIASYTIMDNLGRTLYSKPINGILNEQIDMSGNSNGVYLLRLSNNKGNNVTKRVLKQ